jgi:hypothetical protein
MRYSLQSDKAMLTQSMKAETFLAWEYLGRNDLVRAEEHLRAAEQIYPDYPILQQALASLAYRKDGAIHS